MLYFIGCGPGDRKLITIKGEEILKQCEIVFYFPPYEKVFKDIIGDKQKFIFFNHTFNEIKEIIGRYLDKNIAFLIPGDLAIFSPFPAFLNYFKENIEVIPGVGVYSYFAAKLKKILNPAGKVYTVSFLSTKMLEEKIGDFKFSQLINSKTTLIIYMNIYKIERLVEKLLDIYSESTPIFIGINLSLPDEKIYSGYLNNISSILPIDISEEKFTTIIVGDIDKMPLNIDWWDEKVKSYHCSS